VPENEPEGILRVKLYLGDHIYWEYVLGELPGQPELKNSKIFCFIHRLAALIDLKLLVYVLQVRFDCFC